MIKKCHACRQPINFERWQIWMTPPVMYQHGSKSKWYNTLNACPPNQIFKSINWIIAKIRGYDPTSYHGMNRDTGEKI